MDPAEQRLVLERLIADRGESLEALSVRILERNPAYLQQYMRRGSPRLLPERERGLLARYLGVSDSALGGSDAAWASIPRVDVGVSAGPGRLVDREASSTALLDPALLHHLHVRSDQASIVRVEGDSMLPTLDDGDEVLVDAARRAIPPRGGIFVLRRDGELVVKRLRLANGGVAINSDNPAYPPLHAHPGEIDIVGQVVWLGRTLI